MARKRKKLPTDDDDDVVDDDNDDAVEVNDMVYNVVSVKYFVLFICAH